MASEKNILSITQLNTYIKGIVSADPLLKRVFVKGEISNCKIHSSGHIYLTLKDEGSIIRSVMFRSAASKLKFKPADGMKIIAGGRIDVFERDGQYQLYIDTMQQDGIGSLYLAFELLKKKLLKEGLFDEVHKKRIPRIPHTIGIITAPTGAAVRDMINIISRRFPMTKIKLYPVLVQGADAPADIVKAIEYFSYSNSADVLIVGRGGGSIEDLWAFNDEAVARAVYKCRIPVISAVGHETDFTICDFAADLRAPTPSAAAELAVPNYIDILNYLSNCRARQIAAFDKAITVRKKYLEQIKSRRIFDKPLTMIEDKLLYLDFLSKNIESLFKHKISDKKNSISFLKGKIDALSPYNVLSRGYSIMEDINGKVIKDCLMVSAGDKARVILYNGSVAVTVDKKEENK